MRKGKLFPSIKNYNNKYNKKIFTTCAIIALYLAGTSVPMFGVDQGALQKAILQSDNRALVQSLSMYSGGSGILSPFALGVVPYINASILVDLLATFIPYLETIQKEDGEAGRRELNRYKKLLALIFAIGQVFFSLNYLKPYLYSTSFSYLVSLGMILVTGSMFVIWLSTRIDNKGVGNGTSVFILANIMLTLSTKLTLETLLSSSIFDILFLALFLVTVLICQTIRLDMPLRSARQLGFYDNITKEKRTDVFDIGDKVTAKGNSLSLRFNQAGILPIIITLNVLPIINYLCGGNLPKLISSIIYYVLVVLFNYFYTTIFWDPNKISEQLRKTSVAIKGVTPGKSTIDFLDTQVLVTSFCGGASLCLILFLYEVYSTQSKSVLLGQLNVSSLIIMIGVVYDLQKTTRAVYETGAILEKNLT